MSRRIAVYGKGGIGKSTIASNLTAALSDRGVKVLQIGCDPKHDSTKSLVGGEVQSTVLDYLKGTRPEDRKLGDVVAVGYRGCLCVEAGGPEPGVGCAGRGIISAFDLLESLGSDSISADITLYDVLGDVVCGGFAVPMRNGYADTIYIVTSGEFMSIYAANNILKGVSNYNPDRIGGIVFNSRGNEEEVGRVERFSEAVGVPIIARFARSNIFMEAERRGETIVEMSPDSDIAGLFRNLADKVVEGRRYKAGYLPEGDLEKLILGRNPGRAKPACLPKAEETAERRRTPYASRGADFDEPLSGCAFSGASSVCTSIGGLTTVLHSPKSCAHFTVQLDTSNVKGAVMRGYSTVPTYTNLDVKCTAMSESTMIFGGTYDLRKTVERLAESGKRNFAIITGCPPGIIGDDARSVAESIERERPGIRIAVLDEDGNAAGDFMQGVIDAGAELVRKFDIPGDRIPCSLNLVGTRTMSSSAQSELEQVRGFLAYMGVEVNCVLPGITGMDELSKTSRACANLMLNSDVFTDKLCAFLGDEYGIPTLEEAVRGGVSGTCGWIGCVGRFFGRENEAERLAGEIRERFESLMADLRSILRGKTCCIVSVNRDVSWITEAVEAAGMKILKGYVLDRYDFSEDLADSGEGGGLERVGADDFERILAEIDGLQPDILMSPVTAGVDPRIYQSRLPYSPATGPYSGRWLAEDWARGMLAPKNERWREDATRG